MSDEKCRGTRGGWVKYPGSPVLGGELGTFLGRNAIGCRGAGQRADDTDLEGLTVIGGAAVRATRRATSERGSAAERRGAGEKVPTAERAVDVEHGVPLFSLAAVRPSCGTGQTLWRKR